MGRKITSMGGTVDPSGLDKQEKKFHEDMTLISNPDRRAPIRKIILQGMANSNIYSLDGQFTSENELMVALVKKMTIAGNSDEASPQEQKNLAMLMERVLPPLKASVDSFQLEGYRRDATYKEKAEFILDAIMSGSLPADIGKLFMDNIKAAAEVCDIQDLIDRIEELENGNSKS